LTRVLLHFVKKLLEITTSEMLHFQRNF